MSQARRRRSSLVPILTYDSVHSYFLCWRRHEISGDDIRPVVVEVYACPPEFYMGIPCDEAGKCPAAFGIQDFFNLAGNSVRVRLDDVDWRQSATLWIEDHKLGRKVFLSDDFQLRMMINDRFRDTTQRMSFVIGGHGSPASSTQNVVVSPMPFPEGQSASPVSMASTADGADLKLAY